jgi:hypothetical protein
VFFLVWAVSVGYMASHLKRGWVPHDEGTLGQSAERVLNGQLPHRDFDDYTGGLTFAHALAFREFGISSTSMRLVLFAFFVPWVPAVFYVASRFGSPYSAGAVTLLAVAWSVPNYPAPMPSWYNLFFAVFGLAALLRYFEFGSRRWLVIAGICGGISMLAKIAAVYFMVGALFAFLFREQSLAKMRNGESGERAKVYSATVVLGLTFFLVLFFRMVRKAPGSGGLIYFVLPTTGLILLLVAREFARVGGQNRERFEALLGMCVPFSAGVAIPVLFFLIPYAYHGGFHDLAHGIFATPSRAIRFASYAAESPITMISLSPFVAPVLIGSELGKLGRAICGGLFAIFAWLILIYSATIPAIYQFGWYSMKVAAPALVLSGAAILWVSCAQGKLTMLRQQQIMLVVSITALTSLVQFPFEAGVYFFYVAPLLILMAAALFSSSANPPRFVLAVLAGFYLLFAVLRVTPTFIDLVGHRFAPDIQIERLSLPRAGGLRVDPDAARMYEQLIPLIQTHAKGKFIYAAPDCPEVYFLSGLQSPTRYYFDFSDDPMGHTERVLHALESLQVNVVAIRKLRQFSGPLPADLQNELEERYPRSTNVGFFQVRWRE